jgi:anti-sigma regulatory factor (Ser/Thr protein kinase)
VALTVRDTGSWREPLNGNRGKGLVLMRKLMDDVSVNSGPDGTVVQLRRRIS